MVCTLLDAHRDIAFSYELYPNLLELDEGVSVDLLALADHAETSKDARSYAPVRSFATFMARLERGGVTHSDFAAILRRVHDEGFRLPDLQARLRLIELCADLKKERLGKSRWGMKCNNRYDEYLSRWPKAHFINVLRDGRDVLASQLNTGSFDKTPAEIAQGWVNVHEIFRKLQERPDTHAYTVRYEALTANLEPELRKICTFLELDFDPGMLRHNEQNLTVFKARHLSRDRVASAIDTKMVGRWKKDVTPAQLAEFMAVAGDAMQYYGYE